MPPPLHEVPFLCISMLSYFSNFCILRKIIEKLEWAGREYDLPILIEFRLNSEPET